MTTPQLAQVEGILASSELLPAIKLFVKKSKSRLYGAGVRPLSAREIKALKTAGNHARDWKEIFVHKKFKPINIVNTFFGGRCVVGCFDAAPLLSCGAARMNQGIFNSTIIDSEIGSHCAIVASGVYNYCIKEHSVVSHVGSLACGPGTAFGNGQRLPVGIETGGRDVLAFAELSLPLANAAALLRNDTNFLQEYQRVVEEYCRRCTSPVGIIQDHCIIRNTPTIENAYIGEYSRIDAACSITDSTILSSDKQSTEISSGAMVRASCVQWGCLVSSMAIVDESVLLENSRVERHGKLTRSIIGPNTDIGEGEVTASLVGPLVGFHHQALLIAALWPEGKGNVGYGANVGSNHTGKAPDQELWCGEGVFFGLGVNIKFPANFTKAPYSVFATGVITLPQRMECPFSLIAAPSHAAPEIPPAFNELIPGWALSDNLYMIQRCEEKFKKRFTASRTVIEYPVFRPAIVDMMVATRKRLADASHQKAHYFEADIPGIGKNYLTEKNRAKAIGTYDFFIEYYCLRGLFDRLCTETPEIISRHGNSIYSSSSTDPLWEQQRTLLEQRGYSSRTLIGNLQRLTEMQTTIARWTQQSKVKDDLRGARIITDYNDAHCLATEDSFIKQVWETTNTTNQTIAALMEKLRRFV